MDLKKYIRSIPDYPKKGILFRDITTLIKDPDAFKYTVDKIIEILKSSFSQFEYDDNKYRWTCDMLKIREAINEL